MQTCFAGCELKSFSKIFIISRLIAVSVPVKLVQTDRKGGDAAKRFPWSHQLTDEEAGQYTLKNIFGDWKPF